MRRLVFAALCVAWGSAAFVWALIGLGVIAW